MYLYTKGRHKMYRKNVKIFVLFCLNMALLYGIMIMALFRGV